MLTGLGSISFSSMYRSYDSTGSVHISCDTRDTPDLFSLEAGSLSGTYDRVKWLGSMDQEGKSELFERRGFDRLTLHKIM